MEKIIYRVLNGKGKYQQSYSSALEGAYSWAVDCASLTNGEVYKVTLNEKGETGSSSKIYPKP
jgi:hypothetical protein